MITLNVTERKVAPKTKIVSYKKSIKVFVSVDKARTFIKPIIAEMKRAFNEKRDPNISIDGVSYDSDSEERMLNELGALLLTKYESDF